MNFGEMTDRALSIVAEEGDSFFSNDDAEDAVNEGLDELADLSEFHEVVFSIPMLTLRPYYDLRAHTRKDEQFLSPRRVQNITTNEWLTWVTERWLDARYYRNWRQAQHAASYMWMQGLHTLGVHGMSGGDAGSLRLTAVTIPAPMVHRSDTPRIPETAHLAAVEYAAYDLLVQDNEIDLALTHWKEYVSLAGAFTKDVYSRLQVDRAFKFGSATMRRFP